MSFSPIGKFSSCRKNCLPEAFDTVPEIVGLLLAEETAGSVGNLGDTLRTEPFAFRNALHLGPKTVGVIASIASVAQQQVRIVLTTGTNLTIL